MPKLNPQEMANNRSHRALASAMTALTLDLRPVISLGWLINVQDRQVEVYRANQTPEVLDAPPTLSGEARLPGLTVDATEIW